MSTRIKFSAAVLLLVLAMTPPLLAETVSSMSPSALEHVRNMSVEVNSSSPSVAFFSYVGGSCVGYYENEYCGASANSQGECCGMEIQCPSGNYTWGAFWYPSDGWPRVCE
jgi:hypothetical protein